MIYVSSLLVGVLVGVGYGLLGLRSPAPPIAALIGLLGMLAGEHGISTAKAFLAPDHAAQAASAPADKHGRA